MDNAEKSSVVLDLSFFEEEVWDTQDDNKPVIFRPEVDSYWYLNFQTKNYDWHDPEWEQNNARGKNAVRIIPLWKRRPGAQGSRDVVLSGYFAVVSARDYKRLMHHPDGTKKRWTIQIKYSDEDPELILKMYAIRYGRGDEPRTVMMHREVIGCLLRNSVVDHYNGWGLDNRRQNLAETTQTANMSNARRKRTRNTDLPVGVEKRMFRGEVRYGGIRAKRLGKSKVKTVRSKRTWKSPEPAARWYQNQLKMLHGKRPWVHNPRSLSYPPLPPKMESAPTKRSSRLRQKRLAEPAKRTQVGRKSVSIPF